MSRYQPQPMQQHKETEQMAAVAASKRQPKVTRETTIGPLPDLTLGDLRSLIDATRGAADDTKVSVTTNPVGVLAKRDAVTIKVHA